MRELPVVLASPMQFRVVPLDAEEKIPEFITRHNFFGSAYTGKGTVGAVIDTGTGTHFDLKKVLVKALKWNGEERGLSASPALSHGTFVAGEAHAAKNKKGIIGAAYKSKFYDIQALGANGGTMAQLADAINLATDLGVDAINMSLGCPSPDKTVERAVKRAYAAGIIMIGAAGNEGGDGKKRKNYPSDYKQVISVGAVDSRGRAAKFTQNSYSVVLAVMGVNIYGLLPGNRYGLMSGTSMSSPIVYALALRWCEKHPEIPKKERPAAFLAALKEGVASVGSINYNSRIGWGDLKDATRVAFVPRLVEADISEIC